MEPPLVGRLLDAEEWGRVEVTTAGSSDVLVLFQVDGNEYIGVALRCGVEIWEHEWDSDLKIELARVFAGLTNRYALAATWPDEVEAYPDAVPPPTRLGLGGFDRLLQAVRSRPRHRA